MGVLPEALSRLHAELALPSGSLLQELIRRDLLMAYLQRLVLEALAEVAPAKAPEPAQLERLALQQGLKDVEELDRWRQLHDLSLDALAGLATFAARVEAATELLWGDEVPGRFLERRGSLDQVTLSVLRFSDADLAQELFFQMEDGEVVFAELIDRHGMDPGQPVRGLVGPVALEKLHPVLGRAAERYAPGELIPPLEINGMVHLVRVEQINKAKLDEPMRQRLLGEMRQEWVGEVIQRLQEQLNGPHSQPTP